MTETPDAGGSYAKRTVADVLGAVATSGPGPAGGSVAAISAALAASLVRLAATVSHAWPEAASVGERALHLERQLLDLADEDATAWVHALRHRDDTDARVTARAVPLQIAAAALEVRELARRAVEECAAQVRADAATAVHLAVAAHEAALGVAAANEPS